MNHGEALKWIWPSINAVPAMDMKENAPMKNLSELE